MRRGYFFLLGLLFALACVMAIRDIASAALMVTLGFAAPLVVAASFFAYALCLYPAIALGGGAMRRAAGIALSLLAIGVLAYAPGQSGRRQAEDFARAQRANDRIPAQPVAATSLEIRRPAYQYDGAFDDREPCGDACRAAALYNGLRWVRIVTRAARPRGDDVTTTTFYSVERGDKCAGLSAAAPDARCIVIAPDNQEAAELTLDMTIETMRGTRGFFQLMRAKRIKRAVARVKGQTQEALRQTQVDVDVAATPTILAPRFTGINSEGLEIVTRELRINEIKQKDVFLKLGFAVTPPPGAPILEQKPTDWRAGVNETLTRELIAVLDLPQKEPFDEPQASIISDWIMHARVERAWPPEMIALLRRIVRDDRVNRPTFFDQIFERNPAVASALMPDILDMLENSANDRSLAWSAAYTFPRIDPGLLKPHATRIAALVTGSAALRRRLLPAIGRLGVDPSPYLLPLDAAGKDDEAKLRGACYAERQWAPKLTGALKEQLVATPERKRDRRRLLTAALVGLGERDFVTQTLDPSDRDDARLLNRIERVLQTPRFRPDAICAML